MLWDFCKNQKLLLSRWFKKTFGKDSSKKISLITIDMRSANWITMKGFWMNFRNDNALVRTSWNLSTSCLLWNLEKQCFTGKRLKSKRCWESFASGTKSIFWRPMFARITSICWSSFPKYRFPDLSDNKKSSLMIYERFSAWQIKCKGREFWFWDYYVDSAGKNAFKIANYIKHQLDEDKFGDQLTMFGEK